MHRSAHHPEAVERRDCYDSHPSAGPWGKHIQDPPKRQGCERSSLPAPPGQWLSDGWERGGFASTTRRTLRDNQNLQPVSTDHHCHAELRWPAAPRTTVQPIRPTLAAQYSDRKPTG